MKFVAILFIYGLIIFIRDIGDFIIRRVTVRLVKVGFAWNESTLYGRFLL
jgi:hypothetical protein